MNVTDNGPQAGAQAFSAAPLDASLVDDDLVVRAVREYVALVEAGHRPDRRAFAGRYPEIAQALSACLAGLDFVQAALPDLSDPGASFHASSSGEDSTPPGGTLGDFRILREVGRGGMGIVYEAEQISLARCVALKVLPFAATMDPRQLQRFQNEVRAAASLKHPHIVPVYAVGCQRGVHYYAMQFIDGYSLEAVIRQLRNEKRSEEPGARSDEQLKIANCQLSIVNKTGDQSAAKSEDLLTIDNDQFAIVNCQLSIHTGKRARRRRDAAPGTANTALHQGQT
jgi:hypothetical protein